MGLESDEDEDDEGDEEEEENSDGDMDEEDTVQTNIDEMDTFKLPGAEESAKEGEFLRDSSLFCSCRFTLIILQIFIFFIICNFRCFASRPEDNPSKDKGQH